MTKTKNVDIFKVCKAVAVKRYRFIFMLSAGRDSAVMLNIVRKFIPPEMMHVVHLYHFNPLFSFHKKYFQMIERKYKVKINYFPHYDMQNTNDSRNRKRRLKQADQDAFLRQHFDTRWIIWGYRKDESIERRGQMANLDDGIEYKYNRIFPLMDWSAKRIASFCELKQIPLTVEYSFGYRDMNRLKGVSASWLKNNYPKDFEILSKIYPHIKAEVISYESEDTF